MIEAAVMVLHFSNKIFQNNLKKLLKMAKFGMNSYVQ